MPGTNDANQKRLYLRPQLESKDTVPKEQLALPNAMTPAAQEDGNKTRVQLERLAAKEAAEAEFPDHRGAASGLGCAKATGPMERHPTDKEAAAARTQETVTASLAIGDEDTREVRRLWNKEQTQRQGAKRKLARARARAARDTVRAVVNQRLIALEVEAEQARQLAKEATAKAAAMELEKEAALQDVKEATRQVAAAKRREADALNYADRMYKSQGRSYSLNNACVKGPLYCF